MRSEEAGPAVGSGDEPGLPGSELPGLTGPEVAELLGLQPLPDEGGLFRRTYEEDRKSTRLNSSHVEISYAVFCLKKKKNKE